MLSFSTEFPVATEDAEAFTSAIKQWIAGSPHTSLTHEQLASCPKTGRWKIENGDECLQSLSINSAKSQICAFRHTNWQDGIEWITEAVFSKNDLDSWVGIRTARESDQPQLTLPSAKKPFLVRAVLNRIGGGLDGELFVRDEPHLLQDNDLSMAARLINSDAENYLPVVYVSSYFCGGYAIDYQALARTLGGLAHVVIEPNSSFSAFLQDLTSSRNVYNGAVGVYWPSGEHYRYFPGGELTTELELRQRLAGRLRASLVNRRPLTRCTWTRAEAETAREIFADLKATGSKDVDAYVAAFDAELEVKQKQIDEAEAEISRLKARSVTPFAENSVAQLVFGTEKELYSGEFQAILLDEISKSLNNVQSDSRRQHILEAIVSSSNDSSALRDKRNSLKAVLREYRSMGSNERRELEKLGFDISEDGKHYKLTFFGDNRYVFSLPKSGSDHRGGMNAASDIGKRLF